MSLIHYQIGIKNARSIAIPSLTIHQQLITMNPPQKGSSWSIWRRSTHSVSLHEIESEEGFVRATSFFAVSTGQGSLTEHVNRLFIQLLYCADCALGNLKGGHSILMYNFKTAHPPHPGKPRAFDWNFVTYIGEFDLKWGQPSQAFHVCVNAGCHKQKDFVILSALYRTIQHVHHIHGSLLLYSLFCWSIWEPLKKPVQCGLSRINNFLKIKKKNVCKTAFQDFGHFGCI